MNASDGTFDEVAEEVTANVVNDFEPGLHEICVRGTDSAGNTGPADCTTLVVYDPAGGFVTGGRVDQFPGRRDAADALGGHDLRRVR